jgi:hypothetical protein
MAILPHQCRQAKPQVTAPARSSGAVQVSGRSTGRAHRRTRPAGPLTSAARRLTPPHGQSVKRLCTSLKWGRWNVATYRQRVLVARRDIPPCASLEVRDGHRKGPKVEVASIADLTEVVLTPALDCIILPDSEGECAPAAIRLIWVTPARPGRDRLLVLLSPS